MANIKVQEGVESKICCKEVAEIDVGEASLGKEAYTSTQPSGGSLLIKNKGIRETKRYLTRGY